MPGPIPNQVLMGPGQDLHTVCGVTVTSDRPVVVTVGANKIGQHLGVTGIRLRSGDVVAVPVARHRQRVDRVHDVAGSDQRLDPHTPLGLDPHDHLARVVRVIGDHGVQCRYAFETLG